MCVCWRGRNQVRRNTSFRKSSSNLPIFWQSNKESLVTATLVTEWFRLCFIPEVKRFLELEKLQCTPLILIDNAPGHWSILSSSNLFNELKKKKQQLLIQCFSKKVPSTIENPVPTTLLAFTFSPVEVQESVDAEDSFYS